MQIGFLEEAVAVATLRDVAECARVSLTTVSYVLNNKGAISESTRRRVLHAIREVGYTRRGPFGRTLAYIGEGAFVGTLKQAAAEYGFEIHHVSGAGYVPDCTWDGAYAYSGTIVYGGLWSRSALEEIVSRGPTILLGASFPSVRSDEIWIDNAGAVYTAVEHLVSMGHVHVGLINGPIETVTTAEKRVGFERALRDLPGVVGTCVNASGFTTSAGYEAIRRLFSKQPHITAVISGDVPLTHGILEFCRSEGIAVGSALSLISIRDERSLEQSEPPITVLPIPALEISREAISHLVTRINNPKLPGRRLLIRPEMIHRQSVQPAPKV